MAHFSSSALSYSGTSYLSSSSKLVHKLKLEGPDPQLLPGKIDNGLSWAVYALKVKMTN